MPALKSHATDGIAAGARIQIQRFDIHEADAWDRMAASHRDATIFHSARWARAMQASYGHRPYLLAKMEDARPRALLPLLEVRSLLKGCRGISLPFSDEGGMLCFEDEDGRELWRHATTLGRERGWSYAEVRGPLRCQPDAPAAATFTGHEVDLSGDATAVFEGFDSSVRRAVRKAEKSGVTTRVVNTLEAMHAYYKLHCATRRKHGVPPQSVEFFENIHEHVIRAGLGFLVEATHGGTTVAMSVVLHFGECGIYKFGASDESRLQLRANDLVMWKGMRHCLELGCRRFLMGRTDQGNAGLRRFKRGFGGREYHIRYHRMDLQKGSFRAGSDGQGDGGARLMRLLPMPLFRLAGRLLYPQMD
jgi:hypothetical protein